MRLEERPRPEPGTDDVVVAVRHAGLNPADLAQRAGRYPAPPGSPEDVPGLEVAGVVEAAGERVRRWRVGDRVLGLVGGGGLAEAVAVHERVLAPIPDALSEREAAAVPEAFVTAHDAVRTRGRLAPGETLLVHGAAGGVGSAAVQIGVLIGARVLGVVRSERAAAAVRGLGAEALPDDGFARAALDATGGRGCDVVLELVGAPHFPANLEALAPRGRIVVVGAGAGADAQVPLRLLMARRAEVHGTVLRARDLEEKALAVRAFERELLPALGDGRLRPLIDSEFPLEAIAEAFDRLAGPGKVGKVLVRL